MQGLQSLIWVRALYAFSVCADVSQRVCESGDHSQVKWKATTYKDNEMSGHFSMEVHKTSKKPHENAKQYFLKVNCPQRKQLTWKE